MLLIYSSYERRKLIEQGATDFIGLEKGGWIATVTLKDWFLHLSVKGAYRRILYLEPNAWPNANTIIRGQLNKKSVPAYYLAII